MDGRCSRSAKMSISCQCWSMHLFTTSCGNLFHSLTIRKLKYRATLQEICDPPLLRVESRPLTPVLILVLSNDKNIIFWQVGNPVYHHHVDEKVCTKMSVTTHDNLQVTTTMDGPYSMVPDCRRPLWTCGPDWMSWTRDGLTGIFRVAGCLGVLGIPSAKDVNKSFYSNEFVSFKWAISVAF